MEESAELKLINMSDVQTQEIKWLWYPFIAYGKMTIVQGDPGDGKSTLVLNIAAKLSRGERLEPEMNIDKPVNVIYQTAEDGLADTVKPRLEQAGLDCSRISIIDGSEKSLSMIDERIEKAIIAAEAGLLILDPIQAYLGGGTDMNRANEAREHTKRLGSIAERTGCAIVLIGHMNKGSGAKAAYRGMGSIDFFAVARSVMLAMQIFRGFSYIHSKGYLHRDISFTNVLLQHYENDLTIVKISDFGLVKMEKSDLTSFGSEIKGSLNDSNLQIVGFGNYNMEYETFALTRLIYYVMTGRYNLEKIKNQNIKDFVLKGISSDLDKRYHSVAEMKEAFDVAFPLSGY